MFTLETPRDEKKKLRDSYGDELLQLGQERDDVVVLTADLAGSTRTKYFGEEYPDRFYNLGITEANMMGTAAGLALDGKKPFVSTFAIFATGKPWEQIRQTIAYQNAPVRIVATHAGITVGEDGASHQIIEDIATMRVLPNMRVVVPADCTETASVVRALGDEIEGPIYVRLSRADFPVVYEKCEFELGSAQVLREGSDITICAVGLMLANALEAAEDLAREDISAEIINMSSIKPMDTETLVDSAKRTVRVLTVEEHNIIGGLGSAVSEVLSTEHPVPVERMGINDRYGQSGEAYELVEHYGLTPDDIAERARALVT